MPIYVQYLQSCIIIITTIMLSSECISAVVSVLVKCSQKLRLHKFQSQLQSYQKYIVFTVLVYKLYAWALQVIQ